MVLVELAERVGDRLEGALGVGLQHQVEGRDLAPLDHGEDVLEAGAAGEGHRVRHPGRAGGVGPGPRRRCGPSCHRARRGSSSPASGTASRPSTSTGMEGMASFTSWPWSSNRARTRPQPLPATTGSPTRRVPVSMSAVTTGPRPGSRFDSRTKARAGAFGLAVSLLDVGDEQDRLEQVVDAADLGGGDLDDDRVAAPLLGDEALLDELLADPLRVGVLPVDLGDSDEGRHLGGPSVADRLHGLGHDAVVGGDDDDREVGGLRAAGPHGDERLVAGRVDEGDEPPVPLGLVGADALGDAARLAGRDVGLSDRVEEGGLAVVDVAHHGDDRGAGLEKRGVVVVLVAEEGLELELLLLPGLDEEHLGAERLADQLDHLVGEGLGAGDHLAGVEEDADQVGRVAVELRGELLDGDAPRHEDLAFGDGRVEGGQRGGRGGTEVLEVATTPLLASRPLALGAGAPAGRAAATAAGTARAAAGTAAPPGERAAAGAGASRRAGASPAAGTAAGAGRATGAGGEHAGARGREAPGTGRRRDRLAGRGPEGGGRRAGRRVGGCGGRGSGRAGAGRRRAGAGRGGAGRGGLAERGRLRDPARGAHDAGRGGGQRRRLGDPAGGAHHPRGGGGLGRGGGGERRLRRGRRLGGRLGLGGLLGAQTLRVGQASDAIRHRLLDARGVALDAHLQLVGQVEDDLVVDAELAGQFVDADLLGQAMVPSAAAGCCRLSRSVRRFSRGSASRSGAAMGARSARSRARRRTAASKQRSGSGPRHSHAPRPGPAPSWGCPSASR